MQMHVVYTSITSNMCCVLLCSPQEVIKKLEKRVNALIEESAQASAMGDLQTVRLPMQSHAYNFHVLYIQ